MHFCVNGFLLRKGNGEEEAGATVIVGLWKGRWKVGEQSKVGKDRKREGEADVV